MEVNKPMYPAGSKFHVEFARWLATNTDGIKTLKKLGVPPSYIKSFTESDFSDSTLLRYADKIEQATGLNIAELFFRECYDAFGDEAPFPFSNNADMLNTLKAITDEHGERFVQAPLRLHNDYKAVLTGIYSGKRRLQRHMVTRILEYLRYVQSGDPKPLFKQDAPKRRGNPKRSEKQSTAATQFSPPQSSPPRQPQALPTERRTIDILTTGLSSHADMMSLSDPKQYVDGDRMKVLRAINKILTAAGIDNEKLEQLRAIEAIDANSTLGKLLSAAFTAPALPARHDKKPRK